jgi:hypothetical protein
MQNRLVLTAIMAGSSQAEWDIVNPNHPPQ